jgi:hypothetical protein
MLEEFCISALNCIFFKLFNLHFSVRKDKNVLCNKNLLNKVKHPTGVHDFEGGCQ